MKKTLVFTFFNFLFFTASAQLPTGTVIYERFTQAYFGVKKVPENWPLFLCHFQLNFTPKVSLYRQTNDPITTFDPLSGAIQSVEFEHDGERLTDIILFSDQENGVKIEQAEFLGKRFLIRDSIHRLAWKISNETQKIAGFTCQKAIAERVEINRYRRRSYADTATTYLRRDTLKLSAWFTPDIPVSAGPDEFGGQLPGLILELNVGNGDFSVRYRAKSVSSINEKENIKPPVQGKPLTAKEFALKKESMLKEMYLREEREFRKPGGKG